MALEKILKNSSGIPTGEYERIAGGTLYADNPIGAIVPFGGTDIPAGFLLCNGAEVLKTDYAELYAVIGDAFGTASVNTKFVLPDLTGKTAMGVETGHALGASEDGALPNITSAFQNSLLSWASGTVVDPNSAIYSGGAGYQGGVTEGGAGAWNKIQMDASRSNSIYTDGQTKVDPANVRVNYIIKAKMIAVPADFMSAVDEVVGETTNWINGTYCKARKVNGIVYVHISHADAITLGTSATEVAVLPSGFAPSEEVSGAFLTDNQRDSALNGRVFPSGSISTWRDTTVNNGGSYDTTSILGFISYPLD